MAIGKDGAVVRQLRTLFHVGAIGELTDGQLLERFATSRGEAAELAFAVLLERHGPMVLRVCRGVLADAHDTQDAFQATFLVLVQKARGLWVQDSLGPWLHQVAYRTASCARSAAARRRRHEATAAVVAARETPAEPDTELGRVLHEVIEGLPERYRAPLVLCDLEGRSHDQAARHLGWPVGTVKSRLSRGRQRLRDRLVRRGLAPSAGLLGMPRLDQANASVPTALAGSTASAAVQLATGGTIVPGSAVFLAQGVLRSMSLIQCLKIASVVLVLGAAAGGVDLLAGRGTAGAEPQAEGNIKPAGGNGVSATAVKPGRLRVTVTERGLLAASRNEDVFCPPGGNNTIISILPEGTRVKKGQLVCELDSSGLRDQLRNVSVAALGARAGYENARLTREVAEIAVVEYAQGVYKSELASLKDEVTAAESAVQKAEARLDRTRRALERLDGMVPKGRETTPAEIVVRLDLEDRLDAAEHTVAREKAALERPRTKREVFEKYTRDKTIKELQSEVEKAKSNELAKQQTWELAKDREVKLENQIMNCKLLAPSEGVVVYDDEPRVPQFRTEAGAVVVTGQKIFSVPNPMGPMWVNAKVREAMIDRVQLGQRVRINVDAFANEVLTGRVVQVHPRPDPNTGFMQQDPKVYTTRVEIDKGLPGLRPGMSAQVEILIADLDNVISVPVTEVIYFDDKEHVAVQKPGGGFEWREVTLGVSNGERVEVKQGIQSGEIVIPDPRTLGRAEEKRPKLVTPQRGTTRPGTPR
jgi:RNA polymerase sigma factor (sigma-70 family)